jgi:beta-phosphoglucomutase family hydrolase
MLRAVIFDFDGVIADDERLHLQGFRLALSAHGISITEHQYWQRYLGLDDREAFRTILQDNDRVLDEAEIARLMERKERVFREIASERVEIFPGVRELLDDLRGGPSPIAIAIGSGALRAEILVVLELLELRERFDAIVAADDVRRGKPDPEIFLTACDRLAATVAPGLSPAQCVVIEDSIAGIGAARAAGMRTVGVTNSYSVRDLDADLVVGSLSDLNRARCEWLFSPGATAGG